MESYEELRSRWRDRLQKGSSHHNFDLSRLAPNKFFVLWHDSGCSGSCSSTVELIGVFEDARDFLGFVRHAELPRILDYASGDYRDLPNVTDAYLLDLEEELRNKVDWVLGLIDRSLRGDTISESELSTICSKFNIAFSESNPVVQVLAWGSLADVLTSSSLAEALEEAAAEDEETDEDDSGTPVTTLKRLLATRAFSEHNKEHLALARGFLEQALSF